MEDLYPFIVEEAYELVELIKKYSPKQLIEMLGTMDVNRLQETMIKNGCTKDELRTSSELTHDVTTWYEQDYTPD